MGLVHDVGFVKEAVDTDGPQFRTVDVLQGSAHAAECRPDAVNNYRFSLSHMFNLLLMVRRLPARMFYSFSDINLNIFIIERKCVVTYMI